MRAIMTIDKPQNAITRTISAKDIIQNLTIGYEVAKGQYINKQHTVWDTCSCSPIGRKSQKKQEIEAISNKCGHGKPHDSSNDGCHCNNGFHGAVITGADDLTGKFVKKIIIN